MCGKPSRYTVCRPCSFGDGADMFSNHLSTPGNVMIGFRWLVIEIKDEIKYINGYSQLDTSGGMKQYIEEKCPWRVACQFDVGFVCHYGTMGAQGERAWFDP